MKNRGQQPEWRPITGFRARVYESSLYDDWAEVVNYQDDTHYHIRMAVMTPTDSLRRDGHTDKWIANYAKEFTGVFDCIRDGDKITVTRNGVKVTPDYFSYDTAVCACLAKVFGDDFSGYEHNYEIKDNKARGI